MTVALTVSLVLCASGFQGPEPPKRVSLADAIRIAQLNNPALGAAQSDAQGARETAKAARAMMLPQISANGFATSGNNSSIMASSPSAMPPVWMLVPTGNFLDGNLAFMLPILAPRLRALAGSATWQAQAAAGELVEASADLTLQVTDAYDRVLLSRQMILAEEAKVTAGQELVRTTKALFDSGKGIDASVQRSIAELSEGTRALANARNDEAKAILDLEAAMGADMSTPIDPSDTLLVPPNSLSLADYIAKAKESRGVLMAARARRQASAQDIKAAQGQRLPQVYGSLMSDAANHSDIGGVSAGLTVSFPLFDGGRISAEVAQARSMRTKADAAVKQAEILVEKEVRQRWLDVQTAHVNALSAEAAVSAAKAAYDVTALRVSAGKSLLVEQLDALEALVRAKADLAQSTFDQALAVARLNRAAGGQQ